MFASKLGNPGPVILVIFILYKEKKRKKKKRKSILVATVPDTWLQHFHGRTSWPVVTVVLVVTIL